MDPDPPSLEVNPLAPDAPIHHLLSVKENPMVLQMSDQQLTEMIKRLRTVATSPQTMTAVLQSDARKRRPMTEAQRRRKEILDAL